MQPRVIDAFWERVKKVELTGCWLWTGHMQKNLYGTWSYSEAGKTVTVYAHRFAYVVAVGPIPEGRVLDHLCSVRFCVRPEHLEPVTQRENLRRSTAGQGGADFQRNKTHCPAGHPYSGDNLSTRKGGRRGCRACERRWAAEYKERKRGGPPQPRVYRLKTHCKNGHEFTPDNTYVIPATGQRTCRECKRADVRRYRDANREAYRARDREAKRAAREAAGVAPTVAG